MGGEDKHQTSEMSLQQLVQSLERRGVPLPFEIGSFIVLEVCEEQQRRPCHVDASAVWLSDAGEVLVGRSAPAADDEEASRSTLALLRRVLEVAEPETPPALAELVKNGPSGGWQLDALHDDLEALLVPLNRAAVRRVLARMVRDARRAGGFDSGDIEVTVPEPAADAAEPETPGPERMEIPSAEELDARFDAWLARPLVLGREAAPSQQSQEPSTSEAAAFPQQAPNRRRLSWWIGVVILASVVAVLLGLRHGSLFTTRAPSDGLSASDVAAEAGSAEPEHDVKAAAPMALDAGSHVHDAGPSPWGTIRFRSRPSGAQVWLEVGRAPLEIRGLPVGVAHEVIAFAEGRAPARSVIEADAEWQRTPDGLRLAVTLSLPAGSDGGLEGLGPTRLPDDLGRPSGARGTLVVKSEPAGARVFRLMGFTPTVRVSRLPTARTTRFLLHHPARGSREIAVAPEQWRLDGGLASLDIDVRRFDRTP